MTLRKRLLRMTYSKIIALVMLCLILLGALLLRLPVSSRAGTPTPFIDCFFTSVSASCVTGLIVVDTYTHWSAFGQAVIITLIQIGGLGFMAVIIAFSLAFKKKIGLKARELLQESVGGLQLGGIVRLFKKILAGTFLLELLGGIVLSFDLVPKLGFFKGLLTGIFHSISAFCNAGFDLMGRNGAYSSLTTINADPSFILTISALVIIGGIGFFVWEDLIERKLHFGRYLLHTKIVLVVTAGLLIGGTGLFLLLEYDGALAGMTFPQKLLNAFFCSVTPRTAGFNSTDVAALTPAGRLLTTVLMFIGGSPGSTAGGAKTVTVAVMFIALFSNLGATKAENVFGRRLDETAVKRAAAVITVFLSLAVSGAVFIAFTTPGVSASEALFETFSAMGTVGLSIGVTAKTGTAGRLVLALLMYCGRVGSLTFMMIFKDRKLGGSVQLPEEKISIG